MAGAIDRRELTELRGSRIHAFPEGEALPMWGDIDDIGVNRDSRFWIDVTWDTSLPERIIITRDQLEQLTGRSVVYER